MSKYDFVLYGGRGGVSQNMILYYAMWGEGVSQNMILYYAM